MNFWAEFEPKERQLQDPIEEMMGSNKLKGWHLKGLIRVIVKIRKRRENTVTDWEGHTIEDEWMGKGVRWVAIGWIRLGGIGVMGGVEHFVCGLSGEPEGSSRGMEWWWGREEGNGMKCERHTTLCLIATFVYGTPHMKWLKLWCADASYREDNGFSTVMHFAEDW